MPRRARKKAPIFPFNFYIMTNYYKKAPIEGAFLLWRYGNKRISPKLFKSQNPLNYLKQLRQSDQNNLKSLKN